jgi:hypothetical protein
MNISTLLNLWNKTIYGWDLNRINEGGDLEYLIDVSHWSTQKDQFNKEKFAKYIEEKRIVGLIFKLADANATTGKMYYDDLAEFWYDIAQEYNLLTSGYHWLQASVDPTVAYNVYNDWIKDHPFTLPKIVDFEEPSITNYTDYLWRLQTFTSLSGNETMIYTAKWYLDRIKIALGTSAFKQKTTWMSAYSLWWASYSRYFPTQTISNLYPWIDFQGWQYSATADWPYYKDEDEFDGKEMGGTSSGLDMNLFKKEFLDKYRNVVVEDENNETEEILDNDDVVEEVVIDENNSIKYITKSEMNIRNGAGINFDIIGSLDEGKEICFKDIGGTDCWGKFDDGQWICRSRNGYDYLDVKEN